MKGFNREIRRALFRLKLERAWWRFARGALVLFTMPGRLLDLPAGHPNRFFAAQIILYGGLAVIVLAWALR